MDSNITINIVEPGSTPVVPNTGLFTSGMGGPEATIIGIAAVVMLAALAAIIYYRKKKLNKQGKVGSLLAQYKETLKHKKATTIGLTALALLVSIGTFATLLKLGVKAIDADIQADEVASEETNEVAVAEDGEITIELGDEPVFAYIPATVTVTEDMPAGYTLKAYSEHPTLSSDITDKTIDLVTIPEDEYENAGRLTTSLTDNTWGLSIEKPESEAQDIYFSLPATVDDAITLTDSNYEETKAGDTYTVYYGVYITPDMPYGTYAGASVDYIVEDKASTVIYDGNGLYFNNDISQTINKTKYILEPSDDSEKYSHTFNIDDGGIQHGDVGWGHGGDIMNEVVTMPDAYSLKIQLTYGGGYTSSYGGYLYGYASLWGGVHPNYTAQNDYDNDDSIKNCGGGEVADGRYSGGDTNTTVECEIVGDSVTFAYWATSGGPGSGVTYGYYAVVTGYDADGNLICLPENIIVSGEYLVPNSTIPNEFLGWDENKYATTPSYASEEAIAKELFLEPNTSTIMHAIWRPTAPFNINYDGNNATAGSMESTYNNVTTILSHSDVSFGDIIELYAPNYKKDGYGFVGWSTDQNAWDDLTDDDVTNDPTIYGPNQTITVDGNIVRNINSDTNTSTLYAVWAPAEENNGTPVTLQNWTGCTDLTATTYNAETGTFNVGANTITALMDSRDNNVYTIARLSDGNCWMVENLRLDNTATISTTNTNNPVTVDNNVAIKNNDGNTSNHLSPNSNSWCTSGSADCFNQSYLNTFNTNLGGEGAIASYNGGYDSEKAFQWYSYGNNYNWYSVTAGNGTYSTGEQGAETVDGDICPAGWSLPIGNQTEANGSFSYLDTTMGGTGGGHNGSEQWRSFPNNFVYSGYWYGSSAYNRGYYGFYWSSIAGSTSSAYGLYLSSSGVDPGTGGYNKDYGYSARCVAPVE